MMARVDAIGWKLARMGPMGQMRLTWRVAAASATRERTFHFSLFTVSLLTRLTSGGTFTPGLGHFHRIQCCG
jgi:hypothetical protein